MFHAKLSPYMKHQSLFSEKNKRKPFEMSSAEILTQHAAVADEFRFNESKWYINLIQY